MTDLAFGIANWVSVGTEYVTKAASSTRRKLVTSSRQRHDERLKANAHESPVPYLAPQDGLRPYKWRPLQTKHAFPLLVLQPGKSHQPLNCSLIEEDLDEFVDFCALSYCCGDLSNTLSILCEGQIVSITMNLYDALRRLRQQASALHIWVDALCINQGDLVERGKQVKLMRRIYRQACPCIIWLGTHTEEDVLAFKLLDVIHAFTQSTQPDSDISDLLPNRMSTRYPTSNEQWKALTKLFNRPWFDRVWTLQEVVLPRKILLVCGQFSIDGNSFFSIVELLRSLGSAPGNLNFQGGFIQSVKISSLRKRFFDENRDLYRDLEDLFDCLRIARDRDATDPRDKVLGILGICQADPAWTTTIGYDLTPADIYHSVATHVLDSPQPFRLLSACRPLTTGSRLTTPLPSWVPDWSCRVTTPSCIQNYERNELYRAGGNTGISFTIMDPKDGVEILSVKGKIVSQLVAFVDKHSPTLHQSFQSTYQSKKSKRQKFADWYLYVSIGWILETAKEKRCPEKTMDQFFIAACWSATPESWTRQKFWETMASSLLDPATREEASTFKTSKMFAYFNGYHQHDQTDTIQTAFLSNLETWTRERQFCVTASGHIGWVPREAKSGDIVCVFVGERLPYVLRRHQVTHDDDDDDQANDDAEYIIIGHCFFHGIMIGEVMTDRNIPVSNIRLR